MRLDLFGSQSQSLSVAINNQVSENCYVIPSPRGRANIALVGSMGSKVFSDGSGVIRGGINCLGVSYFVSGTTLVSVDALGNRSALGSVSGGDRVSIATDGKSVIIVNGTTTGYFYNVSSSSFASVTLPYAAYTVTILDTYAIFSSDDQRFFISEVGDTDSFDGLDFARENKSPDEIVAVFEDHSEVIIFGDKTIVPWFNSADIDFPFSQNTAGVVERGLFARFSVVKEDNTLFFLGDDLIVYRFQGYQPVRVSDDGIESQLSDLRLKGFSSDLKNAYGFSYSEHGHKFYQLTVPNQLTAVFNIATSEWHTLKHWDYKTHHAACYVNAYGKHLIGGLDGKIYELSRSHYSDEDKPLKRLRRSNVYSIADRRVNWKLIKLIFDFGSSKVLEGQGSEPVVVLRWSDDSGRSYGNERFLSLGVTADYKAKAIKRDCGSSRARVIEFYVTDPVPFFLTDAFATIR